MFVFPRCYLHWGEMGGVVGNNAEKMVELE
jgi:hypothetical protein